MSGRVVPWSGQRRAGPPPPTRLERQLRDSQIVDELAFHLYRLERTAGRLPDAPPWADVSAPVKDEYRRRAAIAWHLGDPIRMAVMVTRVATSVDPSVPNVPRFAVAAIVHRALRFLAGEGE